MGFAHLTSVIWLMTIFFPFKGKAYVENKNSNPKFLSSGHWKQTRPSFPIKTQRLVWHRPTSIKNGLQSREVPWLAPDRLEGFQISRIPAPAGDHGFCFNLGFRKTNAVTPTSCSSEAGWTSSPEPIPQEGRVGVNAKPDKPGRIPLDLWPNTPGLGNKAWEINCLLTMSHQGQKSPGANLS